MSCLSASRRGRSRHPYTIQTDIQDPQCVRASTDGTQQGWTNSSWTCGSPWTWWEDGTAGRSRRAGKCPKPRSLTRLLAMARDGCRLPTRQMGCRMQTYAGGVQQAARAQTTSSAKSPETAAPDLQLASRSLAILRSEAGGGRLLLRLRLTCV